MPCRPVVALLAALLAAAPAAAQSFSWNVSGDGLWGNAANWTPGGGPPNAAGVTANLTGGFSTLRTVTVDGSFTVGTLSVTNPKYLLTGGSLTLNNNASDALVSGTGTIATDLTVAGTGNAVFRSTGILDLAGAISASGGTVQFNDDTSGGTVVLRGANTYTAATRLYGGTVRVSGGGLSANSNLRFDAVAGTSGLLQGDGDTTFTRSVGTGAGQVQWVRNGGFAAYNGTMTVRLNNGTGTLTFGSGGFAQSGVTLGLTLNNFSNANGLVDVQNGLNLAGTTGRIYVADNGSSAADYARVSGAVINGSLYKDGPGTLELTNAANAVSVVAASNGAVRAVDGVGLPTNALLFFGGNGVLEGSGPTTFNRVFGDTAGRVQWAGLSDGGFSAYNGTMTVQLNAGTGVLTWGGAAGTPFFLAAPAELLLGSATANALTDFQNGLDLSGGEREVTVTDNPHSTADVARLSGAVFNGSLLKTGDGTLELTNPANSFNTVTVPIGTLVVGHSGALGSGSTVTVGPHSVTTRVALLAGANVTVSRPITVTAPSGSTIRLGGTANAPAAFSGTITTDDPLTLTSAATSAANAVNFSGSITGTSYVIVESGFVKFSGTNSYAGETDLNGGTLVLDYAASATSKLSATQPLVMAGGSLTVNGSAGAFTQPVKGLTVNLGQGTISNATGNTLLDFTANGGTLARAGGSVNFVLGGGGIKLPGFASTLVGSWATVGSDFAALDATNFVVPFSNYDVNSFASNANTLANSSQTVAGSPTINSFKIDSGGSTTVTIGTNEILTVATGGIVVASTAGNAPTITGGRLRGPAVGALTVTQNSGQPLTIASEIVATEFSKSGAGLLNVTSANSYTGSTYVNAGTLAANNTTGSATGSGQVFVENGSTLGGGGTIAGRVTVAESGTVAPGNSIGTLTVGPTTFGAGSTFAVELGAGNASDQLALGTNVLEFATGSQLAVSGTRSDTPQTYTVATLSSGDNLKLDANIVANGNTLGSLMVGGTSLGPVQISASSFTAGDSFSLQRSGNALVLTYQPVPEPATVLAVFLGGLGAAGWVRRRRKA